MEKTGLKHRPNFIEYHLNPAITEGYVRLLYPQSPRHPRQKYLLTVKGLALYNEIEAKKEDVDGSEMEEGRTLLGAKSIKK